ncbi:MAG: alpha/beta hydrolase [Hamadaea sp.]|nr:alpha/beta hydrolase [Hamadaea sp.]NUR50899.1 alpha/beta hydrolase [Hamadaea sp.]NUT08428.1 alpha/beta hydrolase [Hamadaea sp.]
MTTFVLVPGMWLGASAWRDVVSPLTALGHSAYPLDLSLEPGTDLDAHVAEVVAVLEKDDLRDVVLVGHSYGGMVVSTAAGQVADRVARVVYLDSGPLPDGMSQFDTTSPEEQEQTRASVVDGLVPVPEHLQAEGRPHPFASVTQGVHYTPEYATLPQTLITCSFPADQVRGMIAAGHPYFAKLQGADVVDLPGDHWPMFSRPGELAEVLAALPSGRPSSR